MASISVLLCFSLFLLSQPQPLLSLNSSPYPYFSSTTTLLNYQKMLHKLKVFIYKPNTPFHYATPAESLFYAALEKSHFVTHDAREAHLFFVPFPPDISTRSLARLIGTLRADFPYWNRALGADHFFLSCAGVGRDSNRNVVELRKNSIQISCFPASRRNDDDGGYFFIPHKDVTLPPPIADKTHAPANVTARFLGYARHGAVTTASLVAELVNDAEFLIETEPSDGVTYGERLSSSKFCLFEYWNDVSWIGEALRFGCVPVVIADRPVNDLPFMDVLRWQEMAVFLRSGGGVRELKHVLNDDTWRDRHEYVRGLGVAASRHFLWDEESQPFDAFNTVMYQLWLRRHTIRYARAE
ncbi:putative glycosyltransferase [Senna tora]|uniref:Putative glycosyltransferase n=1 Tax=Senna tora TaxID=362788 RepID=A0A834TYD5_9FABA|nr:putative glycosyltransferase [Senna tora]